VTGSGAPGRTLRAVARLAAALSLLSACAKEEPPPGALPDTRPPQVVSTTPAQDSVVPGFHGDLDIRFDEPIQPPSDLEQNLDASPAGQYRVGAGFSDLKIHPSGGWFPGAVYVVRVPAGIPDLLSNRTAEPIQVVFSTGPTITGTRVSGRITDRITGGKVLGARVLFEHTGDSIPYTAVSDTGGRFSLPALPTGTYRAFGFRDLNRDLELERSLEPYDSARFDLPDTTSSAALDLRLVEPDSTPPSLVRASALDSLTVELDFDDYLDPSQALDSVQIAVRDTATGATWPVARVTPRPASTSPLGGPGPAPMGVGATRPDTGVVGADTGSVSRDTTGGARLDTGVIRSDSGAAPPDTGPAASSVPTRAADTSRGGRAEAGVPEGTPPPAAPDTSGLPVQALLARLGRPLGSGTYRVTVSGVRNLRHLVGGGDTLFAYPPPDTVARPGGGR